MVTNRFAGRGGLEYLDAFTHGAHDARRLLTHCRYRTATGADDDLRTEIRELKRLVLDLSDRLDVLDGRLSRLEQERRSSREANDFQSPGRRPLGNYSVDKNGIIWDGNLPIGVWGVWGRREVESAGHVHR